MARFERSTVVGVFDDVNRAETAVRDLRSAGFSEDQIGIATHDRHDTLREGEARDLTTHRGGGLLEALASFFGGETESNLVHAFSGMGVPEADANYYDEQFQAGRTVVVVRSDGRYQEAWDVLRRYGATTQPSAETDVNEFGTPTMRDREEIYGSPTGDDFGRTETRGAAPRRTDDLTGDEDRDRTLQLREERLRARKEQVDAGEVSIGKEVVSEREGIDVPITREEVVIERHPVEGMQAAPGDIGEGDEIHIPVREERARLEKETVVREELSAEKRRIQETEHLTGEVRHEEARIEREGDVRLRGDAAGDTDVNLRGRDVSGRDRGIDDLSGDRPRRGRDMNAQGEGLSGRSFRDPDATVGDHEHTYVDGRCVDCGSVEPTDLGASGRSASGMGHQHRFVNGVCTICGQHQNERMP